MSPEAPASQYRGNAGVMHLLQRTLQSLFAVVVLSTLCLVFAHWFVVCIDDETGQTCDIWGIRTTKEDRYGTINPLGFLSLHNLVGWGILLGGGGIAVGLFFAVVRCEEAEEKAKTRLEPVETTCEDIAPVIDDIDTFGLDSDADDVLGERRRRDWRP